MIKSVKTLMPDSSHLMEMAKDFSSNNVEKRNRLLDFENFLIDHGYAVFITFHHFSEILRHKDILECANCVNFIRSLKFVSWIHNWSNTGGAGSVVDLGVSEIRCLLDIENTDTQALRAHVRSKFTKFGSGAQAFSGLEGNWKILREIFIQQAEREREIVAISRSNFVDVNNTKIFDWLKGTRRDRELSDKILNNLEKILYRDIVERGDKRIVDKKGTAHKFLADVRKMRNDSDPAGLNPASQILSDLGICDNDLSEKTTMEHIGDLAQFRQQLRVYSQNVPETWSELVARIDMNSVLSWVIQKSLRKYGQDQNERKGSELTDRHLASFSPYVDIAYVDKRTHQDFAPVRKRVPAVQALGLDIRKTSKYYSIFIEE